MTEIKAIPRNITLYPLDIEIIQAVAEKMPDTGRRNLSAALRLIIREFERMQQTEEDHNDQLIVVS
jgi:hypothetical protein